MTKQRLHAALICYAVIAALSVALLRGRFLLVVTIVLCALAFKSWIAYKQGQQEQTSGPQGVDKPNGGQG